MKIYGGNSKARDFLIMSLTDITFGLVIQCYQSAHGTWKSFIEKYEVSDEKLESLNEVTNRQKNCNIKDTSLDPDIWYNELYNFNLRFNKIKAKYEKDEDELKSHVFDVLPQ